MTPKCQELIELRPNKIAEFRTLHMCVGIYAHKTVSLYTYVLVVCIDFCEQYFLHYNVSVNVNRSTMLPRYTS